MKTTKIEWTDKTWNPVTGCTKVSPGCKHCYAESMARRLQAMGLDKYQNGFKVTLHEEILSEPLAWKSPHTIFVCSMSDLFHQSVPNAFLDKVMQTIEKTPWHNYQILTKRAERMAEYFTSRTIPKNAWLGVTVEAQALKMRMDFLGGLSAPVRFLSCEPILEDLGELDLHNIDWVIVGGESGISARPMNPEWAINIQKQCAEQKVAFFFKQWGTWGEDGVKRSKKTNGSSLLGQEWKEEPKIEIVAI